MLTLIFVIAAYLLGSISFAVVTSKLFGLADPRTYGSGNPGATNVLRSGKKAAAALTLLGDAMKGWLAVSLAMWFSLPGAPSYTIRIATVALAVFIGHLFPVFLRFKGGKGVATALGALLALDIWLGLSALATWLIVAGIFRLSSLAALTAAATVPVYAILFGLPREWIAMCAIMSLLLFWRHKNNIQNLLQGTESRIGRKSRRRRT